MSLKALDAVLEATRSGRITWKKTDPERYETIGELKASIEFHYPQVGGETTTGADIAVVDLGGVVVSFFSGSEGMTKIGQILRAAFPDWEEHLASIESRIDEFIKKVQQA
ncbi:MAG: hypothetical protein WCK27_24230 [Verrucomicrobiota bacterium]